MFIVRDLTDSKNTQHRLNSKLVFNGRFFFEQKRELDDI